MTPGGSFIVDNVLFYPAGPGLSFDGYGLGFTASGAEWNLWGNGAGQSYSLYTCVKGCYTADSGSVTVTQVPGRRPGRCSPSASSALALLGGAGARPSTSIA